MKSFKEVVEQHKDALTAEQPDLVANILERESEFRQSAQGAFYHKTCRLKGAISLGEGSLLLGGNAIESGVHIGKDCLILSHNIIHSSANIEDRVTIGADNIIGEHTNLKPGAKLGNSNKLEGYNLVGSDTDIGSGRTMTRLMALVDDEAYFLPEPDSSGLTASTRRNRVANPPQSHAAKTVSIRPEPGRHHAKQPRSTGTPNPDDDGTTPAA